MLLKLEYGEKRQMTSVAKEMLLVFLQNINDNDQYANYNI